MPVKGVIDNMKIINCDGQIYARHWGKWYILFYDTLKPIKVAKAIEESETL